MPYFGACLAIMVLSANQRSARWSDLQMQAVSPVKQGFVDIDAAEVDAAGPSSSTCTLNGSHLIPFAGRRILQVGSLPAVLTEHGYRQGDILRSIEDIVAGAGLPNAGKNIDGIVLSPHKWSQEQLSAILSKLKGQMGSNCWISLILSSQDDLPFPLQHFETILASIGLMRYRRGALDNGGSRSATWGMVIVRSDYNPVIHAREAAAAGRPDWSIDILENIPSEFMSSNDLIVQLALEKQRHYLFWQNQRSALDPPHALFSKERREFAQVTAIEPQCWESYRLHAQFWNRIGRTDMAHRVLRSIAHIDPKGAGESPSSGDAKGAVHRDDLDDPPLWNGGAPPPRILIITHDYSDYGMDTLYHGLCKVVGEHNVVEFPWKPMLHGQNFQAANNYPCVFHYPGCPATVSQLETDLRQGKFDLILYGDVVQMAYGDEVRRLVNTNPEIPVVLYDTWDDCHTPLGRLLEYIGRERFDLIFKREMLDGVDYGPDTYPLPFGYALGHQPLVPQNMKTRSLFWAGKQEYGLRPLYIQHLEERMGGPLNQHYDQSAYQARLRSSRMGLSFFGCGFDSVRYWELPAHSVMLMAERPPIRIPHNFVDGQTAVFFDDLPEMEAKLDYYLNRPKEMARIAAAGHDHYLKHHRCESRARQMLGRIDRHLGGVLSKGASDLQHARICLTARKEQPGIYLGLVKAENYGWGVCSRYLIKELSKLRSIRILQDHYCTSQNTNLPGPLFQALTNVNFDPLFKKARGIRNYGYTFFENELTPHSVENAKRYDLVLAGSSWCRDRMLEAGITNCDLLIQGIDPERFYPITEERPRDRFVIFSGGKFELRKGQDILLRAVKILQDKYPDIYLVNCWYNLWPESLRQMSHSPYITFENRKNESWQETMNRTYLVNGLDPGRIITLDLVPHVQLRSLYAQTDIAVFPNRCEGGTNLVLMEYMACAKPVIATATSGHNDIVSDKNALLLHQLKDINIVDENGDLIGRWQDPSLEEMVAQLEFAYQHREVIRSIALKAGEHLQEFTWRHCAERLDEIIGR
jgi:glycosyltransferase involved in cell wall biosynthesis